MEINIRFARNKIEQQMRKKIITILMIIPFALFSQNSMNMVLMGTYEWPSLNTEGSDIWGWVDNSTNEEYALVGLNPIYFLNIVNICDIISCQISI